MTAPVVVEAGIAQPSYRYTGDAGEIVSIEHYGAGADYQTLFGQVGITAAAVVDAAHRSLDRTALPPYHRRSAPRMSSNDRLAALSEAGVSIWLDDLSRERLRSGNLAALIRDQSVVGVTTNPTIFAATLSNGEAYDEQVRELAHRGARRAPLR